MKKNMLFVTVLALIAFDAYAVDKSASSYFCQPIKGTIYYKMKSSDVEWSEGKGGDGNYLIRPILLSDISENIDWSLSEGTHLIEHTNGFGQKLPPHLSCKIRKYDDFVDCKSIKYYGEYFHMSLPVSGRGSRFVKTNFNQYMHGITGNEGSEVGPEVTFGTCSRLN